MENKLKELRLDAKEMKELLEKVQRLKVKDILSLDLRRIETEIIQIEDSLKSSSSNPSAPKPSGAGIVPNTTAGRSYDVQIKNYSWEQTDKFVKIYIMNLKNVQSHTKMGDIVCEFTNNSLHLRINNLEAKNHILNIKETAEEINAEKSTYKLKSDMVILYLAKTPESGKWEKLTMSEKKAAAEKADKIKPSKPEESGNPEASIMDLMKNMYDQGDDEMKKTIMKSFAEGMGKQGGLPPM